MKLHKWKKVLISLLILFILGGFFLHFFAPRVITEIDNPAIELVRKLRNSKQSNTVSRNMINRKRLHFKSQDGIDLVANLIYTQSDTVRGTIILLHGIRSNKESFLLLSEKLSSLGYHSVALDSRAHGESGGSHCTFGVKEKYDVSTLITELEKEEQTSKNIGVWGRSLGGAIALQAMGSDSRIRFGVVESTFSDLQTITADYFAYHLGFRFPELSDYLVARAGDIAGFDPGEARPIAYCKKITQPILLVHGDEDKRIDIKYAEKNFAELSHDQKSFHIVKGANHLNVWAIGGQDYFELVMKFISENTEN